MSDEYTPITVDANLLSDDDIAAFLRSMTEAYLITDDDDCERYRQAGHVLAQVAFDRGLIGIWLADDEEGDDA